MSKFVAAFAAAALLATPLIATPALAALGTGAAAPQFVTRGALGGKIIPFDLKAQLKKGPVVLYFFPKAFTSGCTVEAHAFAEATDDFRKAGASVIGVSADNVASLQKFSVEECRNKFAVVSAGPRVIKDYDVQLKMAGISTGLSSRTSYVIDRTGKIVFVHDDMDANEHVRLTLAAVKALKN